MRAYRQRARRRAQQEDHPSRSGPSMKLLRPYGSGAAFRSVYALTSLMKKDQLILLAAQKQAVVALSAEPRI